MSEFLSPAWIADLDDAVRSSSLHTGSASDAAFVVEQHVSGASSGDVSYHLVLDGADSRAVAGPTPSANLVILTDYDTAVALMLGSTNAQHAIADGRMKIRGDLHAVRRRIDAVAGLGDLFAAVRVSTTFASRVTDSAGR